MKKMAIILGALVVLAVAAHLFLYFRSDAYACRDTEGNLTSPAKEAGWVHHTNCKYRFKVDLPLNYQAIPQEKESALLPFLPGEVEQVVFTNQNVELAYIVRVFEKGSALPPQGENASEFRTSNRHNGRYDLVGAWLPENGSEIPAQIDSSFKSVGFRCIGT